MVHSPSLFRLTLVKGFFIGFCLDNIAYCHLSVGIVVQEGMQRLVLLLKFDKS